MRPLRRHQEPEISLAPLIDVVFLLLIFFMVTASFTREAELSIDLPEASSATPPQDQNTIDVTIDVQGRFYVNQKLVVNRKLDSLKQALQQLTKPDSEPLLVITADANTPHQAVVMVMDAARQLGILHVSLATRQP
ncbi:MAG: biopolymer transporter ExbD [Gammaproteobacteria bacterium]|nr:biopolymer transporter ExbD [Gammaproteobacteria bacterium]